MKNIFKKTIEILAQKAVEYTEEAFGSGTGKQKKQIAIAFIIDKLPIPIPFKTIAAQILMELIDESIEMALDNLKAKTA